MPYYNTNNSPLALKNDANIPITPFTCGVDGGGRSLFLCEYTILLLPIEPENCDGRTLPMSIGNQRKGSH